jgi:hypothetical protein
LGLVLWRRFGIPFSVIAAKQFNTKKENTFVSKKEEEEVNVLASEKKEVFDSRLVNSGIYFLGR